MSASNQAFRPTTVQPGAHIAIALVSAALIAIVTAALGSAGAVGTRGLPVPAPLVNVGDGSGSKDNVPTPEPAP